jgi:hypothetical protein
MLCRKRCATPRRATPRRATPRRAACTSPRFAAWCTACALALAIARTCSPVRAPARCRQGRHHRTRRLP